MVIEKSNFSLMRWKFWWGEFVRRLMTSETRFVRMLRLEMLGAGSRFAEEAAFSNLRVLGTCASFVGWIDVSYWQFSPLVMSKGDNANANSALDWVGNDGRQQRGMIGRPLTSSSSCEARARWIGSAKTGWMAGKREIGRAFFPSPSVIESGSELICPLNAFYAGL